jgi:biopolymer transport protein ExbD
MAGGMGGAELGPSSGPRGKKPLDTQINLVPFIDLMAVTISFLIMTAVWTQIGRLQISSSGGPAENQQEEKEKTVPLTLLITEKELRLTAGTSSYDPIPVVRDGKGRVDLSKLNVKLKEVRTQLPDQSAITLQAEDNVRYEDLVRVIDECIGVGLPNVSVAAAMG